MCREYGFPHTEKSYEHSIDKDKKVLENEGVKLLGDFSIQTEAKIDHNNMIFYFGQEKENLFHNRCTWLVHLILGLGEKKR